LRLKGALVGKSDARVTFGRAFLSDLKPWETLSDTLSLPKGCPLAFKNVLLALKAARYSFKNVLLALKAARFAFKGAPVPQDTCVLAQRNRAAI